MTSSDPNNRPGKTGPTPRPAGDAGQVRTVRVPDDRAGQRLDNFLLGQLKGAPRSLVYKIVRSGQVRVNGGRAKAERKLEGGDEVRIPPVRLAEAGERPTPPKGLLDALEAAIVFEDARLLALNKPSGLASHGGSGISHGAIESLRALRPGQTLELVHRLDRDTSGLLIVAKKRSALTELQALMREEGGISKRYLALLTGRMPDGVMTVDAPLHIGHPVAGDDKYGEVEANKRLREQAGLKRLFLHASTLEFALDGGKTPYLLNAPLAPELIDVLDRLA